MKVLQFDTTPELNEVEMGLLEQAVQDVKGKEMWRYVSVRYEELAKARDGVENFKLGRVAAKKFWGNKASNKS